MLFVEFFSWTEWSGRIKCFFGAGLSLTGLAIEKSTRSRVFYPALRPIFRFVSAIRMFLWKAIRF